MAVAWPANLPQRFLNDGYVAQPRANVVRSEMDVGPAKTRRRASVRVMRISASMRMTDAQRRSFESWYFGATLSGTVGFTLTDPDGNLREYFFLDDPQFERLETFWTVRLELQYVDA